MTGEFRDEIVQGVISKFYCYNTKKPPKLISTARREQPIRSIHRWIDLNSVAHVTRRMDMY